MTDATDAYADGMTDGDGLTDGDTDGDGESLAELSAQVDHDSSVIRKLRAEAKKAKGLAEENLRLREEICLRDAGLNHLNERQIDAIFNTLGDGELSPEALVAVAEDLSFVQPQQVQVPLEEQQAHQRMHEASVGAEPSEAHLMTFDEQVAATQSPEELTALLAREGRLAQDF